MDKLDREVALKLMTSDPSDDGADRARILREGRMLARLRHENVVTVYGADEVDGQIGLWMQLIHGSTLDAELASRGPFGAREATLIGVDLCRALAAVHGAGLLHRDIKAQNVMRESGGRTLLMDLGAGLDVARDGPPRPRRLTGTPLYLAPELLQGGAPSVASDIYGLGVLLYHLVTGGFPVDGATAKDVARKHARGERTRLRDARADLPEDFVRTVERALAPQPHARYQSAGDFEEALLGRPAPDPPRPRPSRRWLLGAAAAALSLTAVALWNAEPPAIGRQASAQPTEPAPGDSPPTTAVRSTSVSYTIDAAFHRASRRGDTRLASDARLRPGDLLYLTIEASRPVYAYVYNEDEAGESYLLFPLPGQELSNPLPAGHAHRLPGPQAGEDVQWKVTSAGGREHFLVFVSPERDPRLEAALQGLPAPERGRPVAAARLPESVVGTLRGVGGLAVAPPRAMAGAPRLFPDAPPLRSEPETVSGLWVRRLTLVNH
jgi:serine/threonine-protein kinase